MDWHMQEGLMKTRVRWSELSPSVKIIIMTVGAIQIALLAAALNDIRRRPSYGIRGRKFWWVLCSFIDIAGPIAYFMFGRKDSMLNRKDFI